MKLGKWKNLFIKDNIAGYINTASVNFNAFESFVRYAIAKEHALSGLELKFAIIVGPKIGPAGTTKNMQGCVVRRNIKKFFHG